MDIDEIIVIGIFAIILLAILGAIVEEESNFELCMRYEREIDKCINLIKE